MASLHIPPLTEQETKKSKTIWLFYVPIHKSLSKTSAENAHLIRPAMQEEPVTGMKTGVDAQDSVEPGQRVQLDETRYQSFILREQSLSEPLAH